MARQPIEPLTARERTVLELLRRGLTNAQIASELDITEHTAKDHVSAILRKLGVPNRHLAAYWPEDAPWWARVPVLAPISRLFSRPADGTASALSLVATLVAGAALLVVVAGLGSLAFLVLRSDASVGAARTIVVDELDDLAPGLTFHIVIERYRRYGPAADLYAEHFPQVGPEKRIVENWFDFDETGALSDLRIEERDKEGNVLSSQRLESGQFFIDNELPFATTVEGGREIPLGQQIWRAHDMTAGDYIEALQTAYFELEQELDQHPNAPHVRIDGREYVLLEERSPARSGNRASPTSFSAPYLFDLAPVQQIRRHYYTTDGTALSRSEVWVADAEGNETLVEYSYYLVHDVIEN